MTQLTPDLPRKPHLVIEPPRGWVPLNLRELWAYREMVYRMMMRDIKSRYKQTALGPFWIIVMPLISAGVFTIVFNGIAGLEPGEGQDGNPLHPMVFMYSGLLIWNAFTRAFTSTSSCIRSQGGLINKVYFPRLITPIIGIAGGLLDLVLGCVVLAVIMYGTGTAPTLAVFLTPVFLLLAWATAIAWGLWVASLSVRFRDLSYATGFLVTILMWLTPVVWRGSLLFEGDKVPEQWQKLAEIAFQLNPLYHVVEGFRWALVGYSGWHVTPLTFISLGLTVVIMVAGMFYFRRIDSNVADYI